MLTRMHEQVHARQAAAVPHADERAAEAQGQDQEVLER